MKSLLFILFILLACPQAMFGQRLIAQKDIPRQFIIVFSETKFQPFTQTATYKRLQNKAERAQALKNYQNLMRKRIQKSMRSFKVGKINIRRIYAGKKVILVGRAHHKTLDALRKFDPGVTIIQDVYVQMEFNDAPGGNASTEQIIGWGIEAVGAQNTYGGGKYAFIMDTGIDLDHPDLAVNLNLSQSFVDGETAEDGNGHGTMVAGIIGAKHNSIGTKGVAAGAMVVAAKMIAADESMTYNGIVGALDYVHVIADAGDAVNMSWHIDPVPLVETLFNAYIQGMGANGIFVAIAGGNDAEDCANTYPARVQGPNIYTVSAMTPQRELADFSNFDLPIIYSAPGDNVRVLRRNSDYVTYANGTSMAAPFVTGILLVNDGLMNYDGVLIFDRDSYPDRCASVQ